MKKVNKKLPLAISLVCMPRPQILKLHQQSAILLLKVETLLVDPGFSQSSGQEGNKNSMAS